MALFSFSAISKIGTVGITPRLKSDHEFPSSVERKTPMSVPTSIPRHDGPVRSMRIFNAGTSGSDEEPVVVHGSMPLAPWMTLIVAPSALLQLAPKSVVL